MENGFGKCFLFSRIPNEAGRGAGGGKCILMDDHPAIADTQ